MVIIEKYRSISDEDGGRLFLLDTEKQEVMFTHLNTSSLNVEKIKFCALRKKIRSTI